MCDILKTLTFSKITIHSIKMNEMACKAKEKLKKQNKSVNIYTYC